MDGDVSRLVRDVPIQGDRNPICEDRQSNSLQDQRCPKVYRGQYLRNWNLNQTGEAFPCLRERVVILADAAFDAATAAIWNRIVTIHGEKKMENIKNQKPEVSGHTEEGSIVSCLDELSFANTELSDRLRQIRSLCVMAKHSLEPTLACPCCSYDVLYGVFSAIENIAV